MTADPYARLDAAYLLGGLDADERLAYEAHLATCRRCRAILMPSGSGPNPAPRAMAALVATPVDATIALQPRSWGTEIRLTCWYPHGAAGYSLPAGKSSSPEARYSRRHRSRTSRSPSPTGAPSSL